MKIFLIAVLAFCIVSPVMSQISDEKIRAGADYIYHLKFDSARIVFNEFVISEPQNPAGYFGLTLLEWWKINLDLNDESHDDNFYAKVEKTIDICDEILDDNDENQNALLFKGGALGYRGLLKAIREHYLKAAEDGKESLNLLNKILDLYPDNKDALFGVGTYNYFVDKITEERPILKPLTLIFPKGDKTKGLMQLKEASVNSKYSRIEAMYQLVRIDLNYEKNYPEAETYSVSLFSTYPENPIFEKFLAKSYTLNQKWNEGLEAWKTFLNKFDQNLTGFTSLHQKREANYYTSLCYQRLGRILEAEPNLRYGEELTLSIDKDDTMLGVYTYLMLGWLYDKKGDREKADYYYDKVIDMKDFNDSRSAAERYKINRYN